MGKLKSEALSNTNEDVQEHKLNDLEANLLRALALTRNYYTLSDQYIRSFLYYVCVTRLGYKDSPDLKLQFEFDFDKTDNILTVKLLPADLSPAPVTE